MVGKLYKTPSYLFTLSITKYLKLHSIYRNKSLLAQSSGGSEHGSSLCLVSGEGLMAEGQADEDKRGRNKTTWHTHKLIQSPRTRTHTQPSHFSQAPPISFNTVVLYYRPNFNTRFGGNKQCEKHSSLHLKRAVCVASHFSPVKLCQAKL